MKRILNFLRLPPAEQRLLLLSAFLLGTIRLGLWMIPWRDMRRLLARMTRRTEVPRDADPAYVAKVSWAVAVAARYVPLASCLARALAAHLLLTWRGYPAQLRIGVTKTGQGPLEAHAWLEVEGKIVTGGSEDLTRFKPLLLPGKDVHERDRRHILS